MVLAPARLLRLARELGGRLPPASAPTASVAAAYAVQRAMIAAEREPLAGWKVGAASPAAMRSLGVDEPFFAPVWAHTQVAGTDLGVVSMAALGVRGVEAEFAVEIGAPAPAGADLTADDVRGCVKRVFPALEVTATRFQPAAPFAAFLADCGGHGLTVLGPPQEPAALDGAVRVLVDGEPRAEGGAGNVLGHPLNSLAWLANALAREGLRWEVGQVVMTGATCGNVPVAAGERLEAEMAGGKVGVRLSR